MICQYCGHTIEDGSTVCPYCGSAASQYTAQPFESSAPIHESKYDGMEEEEYSAPAKKSFKLPNVSMPNVSLPNFNASTILALLCALFSLICLFRVSSINRTVKDNTEKLLTAMGQIQSAQLAVEDRISQLDSTLANVQNEAYQQYAGQAISITKDLASLTGPVTAGKNNQMFIVDAKGNLNLNSSFDWQKYNDATRSWVSISFTGTATTNEEYGLRIENTYDSSNNSYRTILWANGITPAAAGSYRCVITDASGFQKTSSEAIVQVSQE